MISVQLSSIRLIPAILTEVVTSSGKSEAPEPVLYLYSTTRDAQNGKTSESNFNFVGLPKSSLATILPVIGFPSPEPMSAPLTVPVNSLGDFQVNVPGVTTPSPKDELKQRVSQADLALIVATSTSSALFVVDCQTL